MELSKTVIAEVARDLDISATDYKRAIERFEAVKQWLATGTYNSGSNPDVFLQGSFRLGTMVRPYINDREGDFDIDQVCELKQVNSQISAKILKNDIGDRLKANATYAQMLDTEGKRCWTLLYASDESRPGFHLDILPSVPSQTGEPSQIAITDKKKPFDIYDWNVSNPNAYYYWFKSLNVFSEDFKRRQQNRIFEANRELYRDPSEIPMQLYRSPLQRSIQIMKRHRDVYFANKDKRPISIIITTIAGHRYRSGDIFETIREFTKYVKQRHADVLRDGYLVSDGILDYSNGAWVIPNPVHQNRINSEIENFADRWNIDADFPQQFFQWVYQLDRDIYRFDASSNSLDLNLKTKKRGQDTQYANFLGHKLKTRMVQNEHVSDNSLLDFIHLGIEGNMDWNEIKEFSEYIYSSEQGSKDVASINFYQIALHRGMSLSQEAIDDIGEILSRNQTSPDFILCCNILLNSVTREMIEKCLKRSSLNDQLSWPIFRLVPIELTIPENSISI